MKITIKLDQGPKVVDLRVAPENKDVLVGTLDTGEEFGTYKGEHYEIVDGTATPLFLDDNNCITEEYELFKSRNTGLLWLRVKGAQRGFRW